MSIECKRRERKGEQKHETIYLNKNIEFNIIP